MYSTLFLEFKWCQLQKSSLAVSPGSIPPSPLCLLSLSVFFLSVINTITDRKKTERERRQRGEGGIEPGEVHTKVGRLTDTARDDFCN